MRAMKEPAWPGRPGGRRQQETEMIDFDQEMKTEMNKEKKGNEAL